MCKYTPKYGPYRLRWPFDTYEHLLKYIFSKHLEYFIKHLEYFIKLIVIINGLLSFNHNWRSRHAVFDVLLAWFLNSPALVTRPTEIFVTILASYHLALLLLLNYISAMTLLKTKTKKFVLLQFTTPLLTAEMLMRLFASWAKPSPTNYTLKRWFFFYFDVFENLLALGSRTEKILFMCFDELFDSSIAQSLELFGRK